MDHRAQVDIIFIDFRKAFDTVLYTALQTFKQTLFHYGKTHDWVKVWLTQCLQRAVVNGYNFNVVKVQSGVPPGNCAQTIDVFTINHGTVLYLIYVELYSIRLLHQTINTQQDKLLLQHELKLISSKVDSNLANEFKHLQVCSTYLQQTSIYLSSKLEITFYFMSPSTPTRKSCLIQKWHFHPTSLTLFPKQQEL